jgi:molecular chaperone HscB
MQLDLGRNHFELFGLRERFELDVADLAARYRDLQRRFHPDKFAGASDQEQRLALAVTAQINEAYQTLKDPLRRGRYLLGLKGVDTDDETDTRMDPAFLVEQMEIREGLDEARAAPDAAARLAALRRDLQERIDGRLAALVTLFHQDSDDARRKARDILREMQFLRKLALTLDDDV